jgi:hypothetical protein
MASVEGYRRVIVSRAGGACEYCRLLQDAAGVTFHIDHVQPKSAGGQIALNNLALSCPGCNLAKSKRQSGPDEKGAIQNLFNPRAYEPWLFGWHLHFSLDRTTGRIVARTCTGEATIQALNMNDPVRAFARKFQMAAGLIG